MGYTTSFSGEFQLSGPLTVAAQQALEGLRQRQFFDNGDDKPDSRCQWILSPDLHHLTWDGQEKFR